MSACAEAVCASLSDQTVCVALASAKALSETAGMVEELGAEAGRWLMSFVSQVQLHRGARNLPAELPGFACHLGMEGSHQTYIMDPIFGSEEQKREGPEGWYPSLGVEGGLSRQRRAMCPDSAMT